MDRFTGRVAVITGGASGIGKATARRLASEGAAVVIVDLNREAGQELAAELKGRYVAADVTSQHDNDAMYREVHD